ncbi:Hypp9161 [Branchiostoma lanceolatum]|uniref:Hypp9161 protein n=1 Tax=Branchiostoma lanceolatum TaxID=7740 RepID=A0A8K0EG34_BRALA|nr:Hypp9161 [Branchiostoma lanceolatum]
MKTRGRNGSAVQAVLSIATRGRITFSPPVRREEPAVQPPHQQAVQPPHQQAVQPPHQQAVQPPQAGGDAGGISQRLRKKRNDRTVETPAEAMEVEMISPLQPAGRKENRKQTAGRRKLQPGVQKGEGGKDGMETAGRRKRKMEDEDWEDSGPESDDSGWEASPGVVGTMPALRQVSFPPPPPGESEEDRRRREEQEEAERKKAWAEWQFAAATERNRIRGEHDRKAVQRELMHRRWLRSLSKKERRKYEKAARRKDSLSALHAERSLLELHSDLVTTLQVGHADIPAAVSVLRRLRDVVFTQRLLTDQPAIVYTLQKVREFAGSRQVQSYICAVLLPQVREFAGSRQVQSNICAVLLPQVREFAGSRQVQSNICAVLLPQVREFAGSRQVQSNICAVLLSQVREFAGSRQVQKLADRLFMSCRVPFMVFEGETFIQAFERSRQNLLEKDARTLEEKLARKADRALKKLQKAAGDQVVPGEEKPQLLPDPAETQDTEAVLRPRTQKQWYRDSNLTLTQPRPRTQKQWYRDSNLTLTQPRPRTQKQWYRDSNLTLTQPRPRTQKQWYRDSNLTLTQPRPRTQKQWYRDSNLTLTQPRPRTQKQWYRDSNLTLTQLRPRTQKQWYWDSNLNLTQPRPRTQKQWYRDSNLTLTQPRPRTQKQWYRDSNLTLTQLRPRTQKQWYRDSNLTLTQLRPRTQKQWYRDSSLNPHPAETQDTEAVVPGQ